MSNLSAKQEASKNPTDVYDFPHRAPTVRLQDLADIMASLRAPDGCPWDKKQTLQSLTPYLLEESAEYIDAVRQGDPDAMRAELGDVLLQVAFAAQIAAENDQFTLQEVIDGIVHKLWSRHPHIFGVGRHAENAQDVERIWEEQKRKERQDQPQNPNPLQRVPRSLPPLMRARALGKAAAKVGFDWETADDVLPKIKEELGEVRAAMTDGARHDIEEEIGDLLFSVVNLARKLDLQPDEALARANAKFERRFSFIVENMQKSDLPLSAEQRHKMESLWNQARAQRVENHVQHAQKQ